MAPPAVQLAVWLPPFIFAHLFAAFFAILSVATLAPGLWRRLLGRTAAPPVSKRAHPSGSDLWRKHSVVRRALLLEWEGVGCAYSTQAGIKTVLKDVSGRAQPYRMTALLGPSGAGKSTLLDILAGRKTLGRLTGTVLVNGRPRGGEFAREVSYVPQEDCFLATMTADETCAFHAAVTLPRGTSRQQRAARAEDVLAAMGLLGARGTLVGGVLPGGISLRGLSGGERRRLSVAVGILAAPSILFLDEPTTGLDSCSALSVVEHLRDRAADTGLTIVASIHQPRAAVWAAFDSVSLLSEGSLLYAGPCSEIVAWFESVGLGPWRPDVHGTACDWVMDLVNIGFDNKPQSNGEGRSIVTREELDAAAARFAAHHAASAAQRHVERGDGSGGKGSGPGKAAAGPPVAAAAPESGDDLSKQDGGSGGPERGGGERLRAGWWTTFCALLWREVLWTIRNPADVAGRMLLFTYLGAGVGVVFWRTADVPGLDSLRDRVNVLFILAQQFLMMPFAYMSLYSADKRHYVADVGSRLYTTFPYYAAKSVAVLPFVILNTLVCTYTAYGMIGLRPVPSALAINGGASMLIYLVAHQVHSVSSIVMPNEDLSFLVTIAWSAFNFYFAGFLIKADNMAVRWLPPLKWLSALNYAYPLYIYAEFKGASFPCSDGLVKPETAATMASLLPGTPAIRSGALTAALTARAPGCTAAGDAVLDYFGVDMPLWAYFLALLAYLAAAHAATYGGLLLLARRERR